VSRRVVFLLASTFLSSSAALAGVTALGKLVFDITHRDLALGFLGLAEFMPALLLVLVTGSVADRFDRRRVTAIAATAEGAVAVVLGLYAGSHPTAVAPIFILVVFFGVARAFVAPASRSLPADIVPAARLPWLVARYSATWQASIIVGPVLGGTLYAVDPMWPFVAMAVLLGLAAVCVLAVDLDPTMIIDEPLVEAAVEPAVGHAAETDDKPSLREAMEGLRFIRHHPLLLGAISLDLFAVLFGGAVALLPAIAEERLGAGAVGLGWLRAAGGIGAAIITLGLAWRPLQRHVGKVLLVAVACFGVFTIVLGSTRSYTVAFVALALLAGADSISVFVRATLVPIVTPQDKRGRVLAVENVFIGASNELGAFESGVAGELLGSAGAVVLGGAATLAVALTWFLAFPTLRDVDRFPDGPVPAPGS
jgi:predicted MFS family arabinose efflux permease